MCLKAGMSSVYLENGETEVLYERPWRNVSRKPPIVAKCVYDRRWRLGNLNWRAALSCVGHNCSMFTLPIRLSAIKTAMYGISLHSRTTKKCAYHLPTHSSNNSLGPNSTARLHQVTSCSEPHPLLVKTRDAALEGAQTLAEFKLVYSYTTN